MIHIHRPPALIYHPQLRKQVENEPWTVREATGDEKGV